MVGIVELDKHPLGPYQLYPGLPFFTIDLNECIRKRLKLPPGQHTIKKVKALKILKSIKRKAEIQSFLFKTPVVLLNGVACTGIASLVLRIGIVALAVNALALGLIANIVGTGLALFAGAVFGYTLVSFLTARLPALSNGFKHEALDAAEKIQELENEDDDAVLIIQA